MIIFKGIRQKNSLFFLSFENDQHKKVEIPIDRHYAKLIETRLSKISVAEQPLVVLQNEEPAE
jgi:hypothetical protein